MARADHRLFLKLLLSVQDVLRSYLMASTGDVNEAEDLFQEVSVVLWEKIEDQGDVRSFKAWALGVCRIEVLKWRRTKGRSRLVFSEETLNMLATTAAEGLDDMDERKNLLRSCLEQLERKARQIVELRYVKSLAVSQVAERIRKSLAATEMILVRIRRTLRSCVERSLRGGEGAAS